MEDVRKRYGSYPQANRDSNLWLKAHFDGKIGYDVYRLSEGTGADLPENPPLPSRRSPMQEFETYITNGEYRVGCTGQTVYLFGRDGAVLAKFRDLKYAYQAYFSPNGKVFAVKSNEGRLAIYHLAEQRLLSKFRYATGADGEQPQDTIGCFSPDGERFFVPLYRADLCSSLLVYRMSDFSLEKRLFDGGNQVLDCIESDAATETYYLLGFFRNPSSESNAYFVARLNGDSLADAAPLSEREYDFYRQYKDFEATGFTTTSACLTPAEVARLKARKHTLARLWQNKQQ